MNRLDFDAACALLGERFEAAAHSRAQFAREHGLSPEEFAAIMPRFDELDAPV